MIRISQVDNAQGAKRYYATADYYSQGQEIVGKWGGKGASRLGLVGTVDKESFERLCDNRHPATGKPLTVRHRTERRVGWDFTFSVPKSLSLLYAMTGDQAIMAAFRNAVDDTMREIESETKTRVRKGRQDRDRTTGNMVWAEFIHTTSRPVDGIPDPQLHAHVLVFNATWDDDEERWKACQIGDIKRDGPYFQAGFRVRLANRLLELGFGIERKRDDFELAGLPKDVLKRFSRRTALIEKVAAEKGITDPDRKGELGAETREKKESTLSWEALRMEWKNRLSDSEREGLARVHRREQPVLRPQRGEKAAVDHAVEHSYVREAVVPERKLVTEALKRGIGAVTVEGVIDEVGKRPLIRSEVAGRKMATTTEMLALESRLIDFARDGRGRCRPLGNADRPFQRDWLNEGQKNAIRASLASRDRISVIRGIAGTGKTTLEQELGEALAETGKPVVALAPSVKASREVLREKAGFANADTVAMFLTDQKGLQQSARDGVILVDEASLLGTRDMHRLFEAADQLNARMILVGDKRQHRSVSAGEPLKLLEERAGLRPAEVTEIVRQQGKDYKKAAKALSEGRVEEAFTQFEKLGWIRELDPAEAYEQLAAAYLAAVAEKKKDGTAKSALVVSPTHKEGDRITGAIRDGLKAEGKLKKERIVPAWVPAHLTIAEKADATQYEPGDLVQFQQNAKGYTKGTRLIVEEEVTPPIEVANRFEVYRPTQLALAVGDRIRITAGGKTKDGKHRLNNGSLFTVEGFNKRGDILVDGKWLIDRDFGHLTHGYVVTSHGSQGDSVSKVFAAISTQSLPATNERTAYVALTRGEEQAVVFTDDRKELLKAMCRPDDPMSATELSGLVAEKPKLTQRLMKGLAFARGIAAFGRPQDAMPPGGARESTAHRGIEHER
jgi:conjugative relaxase-like TrwC/TraI family protein